MENFIFLCSDALKHILHIICFFYYFTDFGILILRHDVKNVCFKLRYSLRKIAKTRASSDSYFPIYDYAFTRENMNTILSIYGKIKIRESRHFEIF